MIIVNVGWKVYRNDVCVKGFYHHQNVKKMNFIKNEKYISNGFECNYICGMPKKINTKKN